MDMREPTALFPTGPSYQVHILGEILNPGTYRVPASTRLSEAIELAGGILERGGTRTVQLRRKGKKTRSVDLIAFKILGDLDSNPYLLDNDVVFIPLKDNVVQIAGAIKRPDTYELTRKTSLLEITKLAGGFSPGVALSAPAKIIRFENENREIIDIPLDSESMKHFRLRSADVVVIPHILTKDKTFDYNIPGLPGDTGLFYPSFEERVFVIGAVDRPGAFPYSPYYSVREYLTLAGGLTKLAKEKEIKVLASTGETKMVDKQTAINPGDTIVVPERYLRPENWLTLVLGISSTALGITTAILTLTR
jgi:protein involved in polysaccharide export with SLBB domain